MLKSSKSLNGHQPNDHRSVCDRCGLWYMASDMAIEPLTNLWVCKSCWEPIHPQMFIKPRFVNYVPPIIRPKIDIYAQGETTSCIPAVMTPGCALPGDISLGGMYDWMSNNSQSGLINVQ